MGLQNFDSMESCHIQIFTPTKKFDLSQRAARIPKMAKVAHSKLGSKEKKEKRSLPDELQGFCNWHDHRFEVPA